MTESCTLKAVDIEGQKGEGPTSIIKQNVLPSEVIFSSASDAVGGSSALVFSKWVSGREELGSPFLFVS